MRRHRAVMTDSTETMTPEGAVPARRNKKMSRGSEFSIFSANSTFNSTLRLTRYMWSAHRVGLGAARLDFFSALSLAAASLVWL